MSFLPAEQPVTDIEAAKVASSGRPAAPAGAASVLRLQETIGNRTTARLLGRAARTGQRPPGRQLQRGVFSALGAGWEMYNHIPDSDPGKPFAQELMRWRMLGMGQMFVKHGSADSDWNDFMLGRPELHRAMLDAFRTIAIDEAARGPTGNQWLGGHRMVSKDITGVRLNELESMRLTLHGCHRIEIRGQVNVDPDGSAMIVRIFPQMTWVDRAALHPGTTTELDDHREVDDSSFTAAGWDYDERIMFEPVGSLLAPDASSRWRVSGGVATHEAGWPPEGSVPQGGRRG